MAVRYSDRVFKAFLSQLKTELANGKIMLYTGSQPSSPNSAPTGTLVAEVTIAGATWTAGSATGGLEFDAPSGVTLSKAAAEEWKFVCSTAGTIGWGRFIANTTGGSGSLSSADVGATDSSAVFPRIDFSVGQNTGDLQLSKITYAVAETGVIQSFTIPFSNIS